MAVTKKQQMQRLIALYRRETGSTQVDMHDVAKFAAKMGWPLPKPKDPLDRLAEQFSQVAREETRMDKKTGRPYRANLAVNSWANGQQMTLWADIDVAPRSFAKKAFVQRREQMVGDAVQLTLDVDHWNSVNSSDEPIKMVMDFTDDVEWRLNADDEDDNNQAA
jgi:hypothetical protein